ncbi:hypothetical protein SAMN05216352_10961 [Alteribacillus bidgolensis]|uniref:Uncharacterized protein n=1 Tax=Alteribacillus bidgolensis TaxID=930129 RepID=A0A1G8LTR5_9BACI|nr:hypothetical protein SAMN05216352_10961 [Alteribacillus bidgolensis]
MFVKDNNLVYLFLLLTAIKKTGENHPVDVISEFIVILATYSMKEMERVLDGRKDFSG